MKTKIFLFLMAILLNFSIKAQNTFDSPVNLGTKSASFTYSNTQSTASSGNNYAGRSTNDVFYKFTLSVAMEVVINHCGSGLSDTYVHLLDGNRTLIVSVDDYSGEGKCSNTYHPYIKRQLAAGTYFVVSEGYSQNGSITTTINGTVASYVPVTSVTLNNTKLTLCVNETAQLSATVNPSNATVSSVMWSSSNTSVATVSTRDGLVSAMASGMATITVTAADGKTATCAVTVVTSIPPYNRKTPVSANTTAMTGYNYIKTRTNTTADGANYMEKVQYFDGLGRPTQTVQVGLTPAQADLVTQQDYDYFGRESNLWLPAIVSGNRGVYRTDFSTKSAATYGNTTYNYASDAKPYSYPVYEYSPMNRVLEQYGPGASWHNGSKSVKTSYLTNTASGDLACVYYYVSGNSDNLSRSGNYAAGTLFVTKTADEEGYLSYEFKDRLGRVVLQRQKNNYNLANETLDTYYVYDDVGNLRYVLPPMASDALTGSSYTPDNATIKNYAYFYKYNARNLVKYKKLPGCEPVYYIYDKADRQVFSQDGEQRKAGKWLLTFYDDLGRQTISGTCTNSLNYDSNPFANTVIKANRTTNATNAMKSYTVSGITLNNAAILTVNYYDNYGFRGYNGILSGAFENSSDDDFNKLYPSGATGMLTGSLSAVLNSSATPSNYLYSVMYYDYRGQVIQTLSNNYAGGLDKEHIAYSFTGKVVKKRHYHFADLEEEGEEDENTQAYTTEENYRYDYDHADRLINTVYRLNSGNEMLLSANTYDELGRLKTVTPHERTDFRSTYSYNIRSQIKGIDAGSAYKETLEYTYNGNIQYMLWIHSGATNSIVMSYDNISRLRTAGYSGQGTSATMYYTYDKNGNIKTINRGLYDNLTLNYNNTNQLYNVNDVIANSSSASVYEFKNYSAGTGQEYTYNVNGAMTKDLNRGISEITYNLLNLPLKVDLKHPHAEARNEYTYSASGKKLKVVSRWASSYSTDPVIGSAINTASLDNTKTTDYVGNFVYENGLLKRILTENGYYSNGNYYFYVRNHLGSNVIV
ncbi:MAG: DUF6443 domain-containing protein, partial [Dysgonamonadaceae bacterium]|nr:DUF6443 domain-containing protein [Dysgonamonadaceae bacterium]